MPGPKLQCPDIYRGSHLTVLSHRASRLPLISNPALDGALDGTLCEVFDGARHGLDGATDGELDGLNGKLDDGLDGALVG